MVAGLTGCARMIGVDKISRKSIGRIGLSMAINYFTINGYTVSVPLNDT